MGENYSTGVRANDALKWQARQRNRKRAPSNDWTNERSEQGSVTARGPRLDPIGEHRKRAVPGPRPSPRSIGECYELFTNRIRLFPCLPCSPPSRLLLLGAIGVCS